MLSFKKEIRIFSLGLGLRYILSLIHILMFDLLHHSVRWSSQRSVTICSYSVATECLREHITFFYYLVYFICNSIHAIKFPSIPTDLLGQEQRQVSKSEAKVDKVQAHRKARPRTMDTVSYTHLDVYKRQRVHLERQIRTVRSASSSSTRFDGQKSK